MLLRLEMAAFLDEILEEVDVSTLPFKHFQILTELLFQGFPPEFSSPEHFNVEHFLNSRKGLKRTLPKKWVCLDVPLEVRING